MKSSSTNETAEHHNGYVGENRRKRIHPTTTVGALLATIAFSGSGAGIYTVFGDVAKTKTEIEVLKANELKKEIIDRENRKELKDDIKEVKQDVKELRSTMEKVLFEVKKSQR